MNLLGPEYIFTNQPISIAIDIEDDPVCPPANNISIVLLKLLPAPDLFHHPPGK
jgi:hypothetical protein